LGRRLIYIRTLHIYSPIWLKFCVLHRYIILLSLCMFCKIGEMEGLLFSCVTVTRVTFTHVPETSTTLWRTNPVEQSLSWEARSSATREEIFRSLQCMEPEVSLPYSQKPSTCPNSEPYESSPRLPQYFLKIHFDIMLPSRFSKWCLTLRVPHQISVCIFCLSDRCHMSRTSHFSWFNHASNIWCGVQIMKLLTVQFSPLTFYVMSTSPDCVPQRHVLERPQPFFFSYCERQNLTPI